MGTMTCFRDGPLVVMLIFGFGFSVPLMIFWTSTRLHHIELSSKLEQNLGILFGSQSDAK